MNTRLVQRRHAGWRWLSHVVVLVVVLVVGAAAVGAAEANDVSLYGSAASLDEQNDQAKRHDFTYLRESSQLQEFVRAGRLVPIRGNSDYRLKDVSYPYARPEVRLFVERLSAQ